VLTEGCRHAGRSKEPGQLTTRRSASTTSLQSPPRVRGCWRDPHSPETHGGDWSDVVEALRRVVSWPVPCSGPRGAALGEHARSLRAAGVDQGVPPRGPGISVPGHRHRPRRQVRDLLRPGLSKARVAYSYVFFLPETISLVLPVAVLFAVVFTVGALGRHSELTAAKASGISFHRVVRPLLLASLAVVLLDLGLTELAPGASARRAELLGEKTARPTSSRFSPFVYRADSGWVYSIRSLELRANGAEMRDPIMERGGPGGLPDDPGRGATRHVRHGTAKRGWTLTKGAVRYLLGPGREPTFNSTPSGSPRCARRPPPCSPSPRRRTRCATRSWAVCGRAGPLRLGHAEAARRAGAQAVGAVRLHHRRPVRGTARDLHAAERHGLGSGRVSRTTFVIS